MTDNEIIKALECCEFGDCDNCPLDENQQCQMLFHDALDLINSQKEEIEGLKHTPIIGGLCPMWKAEAIREFAERLERLKKFRVCLHSNKFELSVTMREVDNLVKEMVGDGNG